MRLNEGDRHALDPQPLRPPGGGGTGRDEHARGGRTSRGGLRGVGLSKARRRQGDGGGAIPAGDQFGRFTTYAALGEAISLAYAWTAYDYDVVDEGLADEDLLACDEDCDCDGIAIDEEDDTIRIEDL